jgi:aryl-alcohol dehydrogenase-like predicted oxidoreductase
MIRLCCHASLHRIRSDWVDVMLCHEGGIDDPSVYLEAFELLKQQGKIRAYGISTNDLAVLKRFNVNDTCDVVEVEYSLLRREPEAEFLPYCRERGIGVLARGPLAQGLLSGNYSRDTVFTDSIRSRWHEDAGLQARFEDDVAAVERLKSVVVPGREMVKAAIQFAFSHASCPVAIPGAKSPLQAEVNAVAGHKILAQAERVRMTELVGG